MPPNPRFKDGLKLSMLGGSLLGVPQSGLPDRTFARSQGCWNCIHAKSPVDRWLQKRAQKLEYAVRVALQSQLGESDPQVIPIRRQIDQFDGMIARREVFACDVGRTQNRKGGTEPVGDFVASAFLCDRWTGRDGASLARDGSKLDDLPEELRDKIDGPEPTSLAKLNEKIIVDDDDDEEWIVEKTPGELS
jgi:hypothetical protein